uniref:Uncharacterized protein n=1 Tax=Lepeophtheirus salmonis TaxID=72036 RepID=A0A0K2V164_LEPSM
MVILSVIVIVDNIEEKNACKEEGRKNHMVSLFKILM